MTGSGFGSSLLVRTTVMVLAVTLLVGFAGLGLARRIARERQAQAQGEALEALLDVVGPTAAAAAFAGDRALADQVVRNLVATPNVNRAILRAGQEVLAQAARPGAPDPAAGSGARSRLLASPFSAAVQVGELTLVPDPWEAARQSERYLGILRGVLSGLAAVLGLALVLTIHGFIIRPLTAFSRQLQRLEQDGGGLLAVPGGHAGDELGELVQAANRLVQRLVRADWKEQEANRRPPARGLGPEAGQDAAGVFLVAGDGALEVWTPACPGILGWEGEPRAGADFAALFGAGAAEVEDCLGRCRSGGARAVATLRLPDAGKGGHRWVRLSLDRIGPDWIQGLAREVPEP